MSRVLCLWSEPSVAAVSAPSTNVLQVWWSHTVAWCHLCWDHFYHEKEQTLNQGFLFRLTPRKHIGIHLPTSCFFSATEGAEIAKKGGGWKRKLKTGDLVLYHLIRIIIICLWLSSSNCLIKASWVHQREGKIYLRDKESNITEVEKFFKEVTDSGPYKQKLRDSCSVFVFLIYL